MAQIDVILAVWWRQNSLRFYTMRQNSVKTLITKPAHTLPIMNSEPRLFWVTHKRRAECGFFVTYSYIKTFEVTLNNFFHKFF